MIEGKLIFFRTDSSLKIGSGHVMRCLTLAQGLSKAGARCEFITRSHEGNLAAYVENCGFTCHLLPAVAMPNLCEQGYVSWLGCSQQQDAQETLEIIKELRPAWMIVDHYALDENWESKVKEAVEHLMVIDDLANRKHYCDLLLDQNLGRCCLDYQLLLPAFCRQLYGPEFALLRSEFAQWRDISLKRRRNKECNSILINMGGIDKDNITLEVLEALKSSCLPPSCELNIVMGALAPGTEQVKLITQNLPWKANIFLGVSNMAQLMAASDLAIGAAGSTTWERCVVGLPAIMIVIAENQKIVAKNLAAEGACLLIENVNEIHTLLPVYIERIFNEKELLAGFSATCAAIADGKGINKVIALMSE